MCVCVCESCYTCTLLQSSYERYLLFLALFHDSGQNLQLAFRLYRGPLLIVLFLLSIGVNVYGWRSSGVNHVLIFELDPRNHLSEQHLMELSSILGVIWALSLLSFIYSVSLSIPPYVNPLTLVCIMMAFLLNPIKMFRHEARFWLLKIIVNIYGAKSILFITRVKTRTRSIIRYFRDVC